jgi:hypothetical protein
MTVAGARPPKTTSAPWFAGSVSHDRHGPAACRTPSPNTSLGSCSPAQINLARFLPQTLFTLPFLIYYQALAARSEPPLAQRAARRAGCLRSMLFFTAEIHADRRHGRHFPSSPSS